MCAVFYDIVMFVAKKLARKMVTIVIFTVTLKRHPRLHAEVCKSKPKPKHQADQPLLTMAGQPSMCHKSTVVVNIKLSSSEYLCTQ